MRAALFCLTILLATTAQMRGTAGGESTGLEVFVLPTIQYAHEDIWTKTPNGRGPHFTAVGQIVRNQPVHILVSAARFGTDPDGTAEVNYRVLSVRPDGTAGMAQEWLILIPRGKARDPNMIHRAAQQLIWVFGKDDPLGTWQVVVEATDVISGTTVRREQSFRLCEDELAQEPLPAGTDQGRWLMNYHHKPVPQQLLAAIKFIAENPPAGARPRPDAENGAQLGFFEQILADNPWLLPHIVARLEKAEGRERELLATCLAYAKRDDLDFYQTLSGKAREAFMLQRVQTWPVPTKEPLNGVQLDVLWGRFFASGRFAPIRELVAALAYHPYNDALDGYKKLKTKPAKLPTEVLKSIVFHAAIWSLRSNIQQDKVVRDYCEGILLRKELPAAEHGWLAGAFQVALENLKKAVPLDPPAKKPD